MLFLNGLRFDIIEQSWSYISFIQFSFNLIGILWSYNTSDVILNFINHSFILWFTFSLISLSLWTINPKYPNLSLSIIFWLRSLTTRLLYVFLLIIDLHFRYYVLVNRKSSDTSASCHQISIETQKQKNKKQKSFLFNWTDGKGVLLLIGGEWLQWHVYVR